MNCIPFSPRWLPDLTALINGHIVQVPPGWALMEHQVAAALTIPSLWAVHYPETDELRTETLCVVDQECLVAAAQWCYPVARKPTGLAGLPVTGLVSCIVGEPGHVTALLFLLEILTERCSARGCRELSIGRCAFGVGWLGIPRTWTHLILGLQRSGFSQSSRWGIMTGATDILPVSVPECVASMRSAWRVNEDALEWSLRLYADDRLVGECSAWGIPRHFAACDGYADWITIEWLGVEPPYRRRGIGRWLLSEQLQRQARRGVTRVILWTEPDNRAARQIGESLGFHYGPECWDFVKAL